MSRGVRDAYRYTKKTVDGKEIETTWYCSFNYVDADGIKRKKTKRGFKREKDAKQWKADFLAAVAVETYEKQRRKEEEAENRRKAEMPALNDMTFSELVDHYREDNKTSIKEQTWHTKEAIIRSKLIPYFGDKKIEDITKTDIKKWHNWLADSVDKQGKKYSTVYLRTVHTQMSAILSFGVECYGLSQNAAKGYNTFKRKSPLKKKFWTKDEYFRFREAIMDKPCSFYAFEILYWCGLRIGELLALTPADIDFDKQTINVTKSYKKLNGKEIISDPKTKKSIRIVVMPEEISEELKEYIDSFYKIEKNQRIFNFSSSFLHHEMTRGSNAAGLDRIPVHGLRHSHVSLLIDMGWDAVKVAERMGHEAIDITYEYAHMFPNAQQEIAKSLNNLIKGDDADEQE